ncbi:MAG: hypothetical protein WA421_06225 [Nitrososphaeraceae archaeon]
MASKISSICAAVGLLPIIIDMDEFTIDIFQTVTLCHDELDICLEKHKNNFIQNKIIN